MLLGQRGKRLVWPTLFWVFAKVFCIPGGCAQSFGKGPLRQKKVLRDLWRAKSELRVTFGLASMEKRTLRDTLGGILRGFFRRRDFLEDVWMAFSP